MYYLIIIKLLIFTILDVMSSFLDNCYINTTKLECLYNIVILCRFSV